MTNELSLNNSVIKLLTTLRLKKKIDAFLLNYERYLLVSFCHIFITTIE